MNDKVLKGGMRNFLFVLVIFCLGCTSSISQQVKTVDDRYDQVVFDDGVSLEEAKIIAQKELIRQNYANLYDLENPKEAREISDLPDYQKYWFVTFDELAPGSIPFIFMTIIDKKSGEVKFSDDYVEGKDWILEANLLRLRR